MKALFTGFHILYRLSQYSQYCLRYGLRGAEGGGKNFLRGYPYPGCVVDLRGAITQQQERQFTRGLVCVKAREASFHTPTRILNVLLVAELFLDVSPRRTFFLGGKFFPFTSDSLALVTQ